MKLYFHPRPRIFLKIFIVCLILLALKFTFFNNKIYPEKPQKNTRPAVLTVINNLKEISNFELAQNTWKCYCKIFNYKYILIVMETSPDLKEKCPQKDIMFRRHCVTVNILKQNPDIPYILFLDADMGVVNPRHLIESYIDPYYDLFFYERIFSPEIAAGSYIVKNTPYAMGFLEDWAAYDSKVPKSFHGSDNAALHQVFVDRFAPNHEGNETCGKIWEKSKNWENVKAFVACARAIVKNNLTFDRIKIAGKTSRTSWTRDGWLTNSKWSSKDFILHGWKESKHDKPAFGRWSSPFTNKADFSLDKCSMNQPDPYINWEYNKKLIKPEEWVKTEIELEAAKAKIKYIDVAENLLLKSKSNKKVRK